MTAGPLPERVAWTAVARCAVVSLVLLGRGGIHQPRRNVGRLIRFADGSGARVYRETAVERPPTDPCLLVVTFRLRRVRGAGHTLFRWESILNTPLFVGFPGFVSKLWLAHDALDRYRGIYEWDGPGPAERYARSLWRVLALVSERGSIDYRVVPGVRRDAALAHPELLDGEPAAVEPAWWRVVGAA